jgi:hypothetical protein
MTLSIFLAKAFCLYFLITGIALVINKQRYVNIYKDMTSNPALLLLSGVIATIIGILLVLSHNVWVLGWPVLITIAGWMSFLKGATLLLFPQQMVSFFKPLYTEKRLTIIGYYVLALAVIYGYFGFFI